MVAHRGDTKRSAAEPTRSLRDGPPAGSRSHCDLDCRPRHFTAGPAAAPIWSRPWTSGGSAWATSSRRRVGSCCSSACSCRGSASKPDRETRTYAAGGEECCTGFDTFSLFTTLIIPGMDFLLVGAALAPWILVWIVVRGHELSWPPGEVTMIVGAIAAHADPLQRSHRPRRLHARVRSLDIGWYLGLLGSLTIVAGGAISQITPRRRAAQAARHVLQPRCGVPVTCRRRSMTDAIQASSRTTCATPARPTATSRSSSCASPRPRRWPLRAGSAAATRSRPTRPRSTRCASPCMPCRWTASS